MRKPDALAQVEKELQAERASAMRRIAEGLEKVLAELAGSQQGTPEYRAVWKRAQRQLWYLVVQREAMGLRRHEDLWTAYKIPTKLRPNP